MPTLERARAKHNERVAQLAKARRAQEKALTALIRKEAKRVECERAVIRSAKALDKIRAAAVHTTGPTGSVADKLLDEVKTKPTPAAQLNDPVPDLGKPKAKPKSITTTEVEDLTHRMAASMQEAGFNYVVVPRKPSRKRRSPDDFKADLANKKSATDGPAAD